MVEVLTPAVTVTASAVAVLVALDQITAISRWQRRATFWREEVKSTSLERDQLIFQSLSRDAISRVIALQAISGTKLLIPIFALTAGIWIAFTMGKSFSTNLALDVFLKRKSNWTDEENLQLIFILLPFLFITFPACIAFTYIMVERRRIKEDYISGGRVFIYHQSLLEKHGWKMLREYTRGVGLDVINIFLIFLFSTGVLFISVFVGLRSGFHTTINGLREPSNQSIYSMPEYTSYYFSVGIFMCSMGLVAISRIILLFPYKWQHPRTLGAQNA